MTADTPTPDAKSDGRADPVDGRPGGCPSCAVEPWESCDDPWHTEPAPPPVPEPWEWKLIENDDRASAVFPIALFCGDQFITILTRDQGRSLAAALARPAPPAPTGERPTDTGLLRTTAKLHGIVSPSGAALITSAAVEIDALRAVLDAQSTHPVRPDAEVALAEQVAVGDVIFASYHAPRVGGNCWGGKEELVCAWVVVNEIKHHTDVTVTLLSSPEDSPEHTRWVEYPRAAPIVRRPPPAVSPSPPEAGEGTE